MRSLASKLGITLAVSALVAIAAELYLRVASPVGFLAPHAFGVRASGEWTDLVHVPSERFGLLYETAPNLEREARGFHLRTNSLGLRDDGEPLPRDTPGLVRIAVIGDSMAFGMGVDQGQDFPAQLELVLNQGESSATRRFEVLNFGVSGYSVLDEVATLREKALPLEPDLVLVAYCLNDPEVAPFQPRQARFQPARWWQHSHVLRLAARKLHTSRMRRYGDGNLWRCLHAPDGPFWPTAARAFDDVRDLCGAHEVPVALAVLPMLTASWTWSEYPYRDLHAHVTREARARGFHVVDLADALAAQDPTSLVFGGGDIHFTPQGNVAVAHALAEHLRPLLERLPVGPASAGH